MRQKVLTIAAWRFKNFSERKTFQKMSQMLTRILSEQPIRLSSLDQGQFYVCCQKKCLQPLDNKLLNKFIHSEIQLLKETAIYAGSN